MMPPRHSGEDGSIAISKNQRQLEFTLVSAFSGLAVIGVIAVIWSLGTIYGRQSEMRMTLPHRHAATAKESAIKQCTSQTKQALATCVEEFISASEEVARSEEDLTAQQMAAWASLIAAIIAALSLPVSALGLWALLRTIRQGEDGLKRAAEANALTKDSIATENRAWLIESRTGSGANMGPTSRLIEGISLTIDWRNAGNTPARNVYSKGGIAILSPDDDVELAEFEMPAPQEGGRGLMGQGKEITVGPMPIDFDIYARALRGEIIIMALSWVTYQDVFSEQIHRSEVAFKIIPKIPVDLAKNPDCPLNLVQWKAVSRHNIAT